VRVIYWVSMIIPRSFANLVLSRDMACVYEAGDAKIELSRGEMNSTRIVLEVQQRNVVLSNESRIVVFVFVVRSQVMKRRSYLMAGRTS
jgi:hypothetical protein